MIVSLTEAIYNNLECWLFRALINSFTNCEKIIYLIDSSHMVNKRHHRKNNNNSNTYTPKIEIDEELLLNQCLQMH